MRMLQPEQNAVLEDEWPVFFPYLDSDDLQAATHRIALPTLVLSEHANVQLVDPCGAQTTRQALLMDSTFARLGSTA